MLAWLHSRKGFLSGFHIPGKRELSSLPKKHTVGMCKCVCYIYTYTHTNICNYTHTYFFKTNWFTDNTSLLVEKLREQTWQMLVKLYKVPAENAQILQQQKRPNSFWAVVPGPWPQGMKESEFKNTKPSKMGSDSPQQHVVNIGYWRKDHKSWKVTSSLGRHKASVYLAHNVGKGWAQYDRAEPLPLTNAAMNTHRTDAKSSGFVRGLHYNFEGCFLTVELAEYHLAELLLPMVLNLSFHSLPS